MAGNAGRKSTMVHIQLEISAESLGQAESAASQILLERRFGIQFQNHSLSKMPRRGWQKDKTDPNRKVGHFLFSIDALVDDPADERLRVWLRAVTHSDLYTAVLISPRPSDSAPKALSLAEGPPTGMSKARWHELMGDARPTTRSTMSAARRMELGL